MNHGGKEKFCRTQVNFLSTLALYIFFLFFLPLTNSDLQEFFLRKFLCQNSAKSIEICNFMEYFLNRDI